MITKGVITSIPTTVDGNKYGVRLPFFESATIDADEIIYEATLSEAPGIKQGYSIGDVVYCSFEDNDYGRPVIIGKLFAAGLDNVGAELSVENIDVTGSASLPKRTTIGDATEQDVANIVDIKNKVSKFGDNVLGPITFQNVVQYTAGYNLDLLNQDGTIAKRVDTSDLFEAAGDVSNKVSKTGDTMTGTLTLKSDLQLKTGNDIDLLGSNDTVIDTMTTDELFSIPSDISTLQGNVSTMQGDISDMDGSITTLTSNYSSLSSSVNGLSSQVGQNTLDIEGSLKTITYTYGYGASETVAPGDSAFTYTAMPPLQDGWYIWRRSVATKNDQSTDITYEMIQGATGPQGPGGGGGLNTATVWLFQRAAQGVPAVPVNNLRYTFATGVLAPIPPATTLEGWSQDIPTDDGNPCYVTIATASSADASDDIAGSGDPGGAEWSTVSEFVKSGTDGAPGAHGYNAATINMYKRVATLASGDKPYYGYGGAVTYTFSDGSLSPTPSSSESGASHGWTTSIPSGTDPCYISSASAISQDPTDPILGNDWTSPALLVENGRTGQSVSNIINYYFATTITDPAQLPAKGNSAWKTDPADTPLSAAAPYLWNYEDTYVGTEPDPFSTDPTIIGTYGEDGRGISSITEYYQISNSSTTAPLTWETTPMPTTLQYPFLWNYEVVTYTDGTTESTDPRIIGTHGVDGDAATSFSLLCSSYAVVRDINDDQVTPTTITFTGYAQTGTDPQTTYSGRYKIYTTTDGDTWSVVTFSGNEYVDADQQGAYTFTVPTGTSIVGIKCELYRAGGTTELLDSQTVPYILTGRDGADGYTVILTNESHSFSADAEGHALTATTSSQVIAYKGADQIGATIGTLPTAPTGMTLARTGVNGTTNVGFTVTVGYDMVTSQGTLEIPITVDGHSFTKNFSYALAQRGLAGEDGLNVTIVWLFQRSSTGAPSKPTRNLSYDFTTGVLSPIAPATDLEGWSQTIPSGSDLIPCYVTTATASSQETVDVIDYGEWKSVELFVQSGEDGYNTATINVYKRSLTQPAKPYTNYTGSLTYTFSTGTLSPAPTTSEAGGWSLSIPTADSNSYPCWVSSISAISRGNQATLNVSSWTSPAKLVENGVSVESVVPIFYMKDASLDVELKGNTSQAANPTPTDPQIVRNVRGHNEIKVIGKNLMSEGFEDYTKYSMTKKDGSYDVVAPEHLSSGVRVNVTTKSTGYAVIVSAASVCAELRRMLLENSGTSCTISCDVYCSVNQTIGLSVRETNGTNTIVDFGNVSVQANQKIRVHSTNTIQTVANGTQRLYIGIGGLASGNYIELGNFQIEKGSVATSYLPQQSRVYPIDFPAPVDNIFDLSSSRRFECNITSDGLWGVYEGAYTLRVPISPNRRYVITDSNTSETIFRAGICNSDDVPSEEAPVTLSSVTRYQNTDVPIVVTAGANARYVIVQFSAANAEASVPSLQIRPLWSGLEVMELNKIGTYQDYIWKDGDTWKIKKYITSYTVSGTENWSKSTASATHSYYWTDNPVFNVVNFDTVPGESQNADRVVQAYCDRFTPGAYSADTVPDVFDADGYGIFTIDKKSSYAQLRFNMGIDTEYNDATKFKTYLKTILPTVWFVLATPVDVEITDSNLKYQLEMLSNATAYSGGASIVQTNEYDAFDLSYDLTAPEGPPAPGPEEITARVLTPDEWSLLIPTYIKGYTYYQCLQVKYSDGTVAFSDVNLDSEFDDIQVSMSHMETDILQNKESIVLKADSSMVNSAFDDLNGRTTTLEISTAQLEVTANGIKGTVENVQSSLNSDYTKSEDLKSVIEQTAKSWDATFISETKLATLDNVKSATDAVSTAVETMIRLDGDGITVSKSDSKIRSVFNNSSLDFIDTQNNNNKLAWIDAVDGLGGSQLTVGHYDVNSPTLRWRIFTNEDGSHLTFTRHG